MKLFRYEVKIEVYREGIISGIRKILENNNLSELENLYISLLLGLVDPSTEYNINMYGTRSYFTNTGLLRYKSILDKVIEVLNKNGYHTYELIRFINNNSPRIVYKDQYQVVIRGY